MMTHFRERHVCKPNVNIDLVTSPNVIKLTLPINLVSNHPSNFLSTCKRFPGSFCPVWSTCNLSQITAEPLPDVLSDAEPLILSGSNISSRFPSMSTCGDLESLEVLAEEMNICNPRGAPEDSFTWRASVWLHLRLC